MVEKIATQAVSFSALFSLNGSFGIHECDLPENTSAKNGPLIGPFFIDYIILLSRILLKAAFDMPYLRWSGENHPNAGLQTSSEPKD